MMPSFLSRVINFFLVVSLALLLIGCTTKLSDQKNNAFGTALNTPETKSKNTLPALPSFIPKSATPLPLNLKTPTLTKVPLLTLTSSFAPTITWTPVPTIMPDEIQRTILGYYTDNGGCELPCWWGITPGKTPWQEVRRVFSPLAHEQGPFISEKGFFIYTYHFEVPHHLDPLGLGFFEPTLWVRDNIVVAIGLNSGWIERNFDYSLAGLLKTFGQPDEIWMNLSTDAPDHKANYEVDIFYASKGIFLNSTDTGSFTENSATICPQMFRRGSFPPGILALPPLNEFSYAEITQIFLDSRLDIAVPTFHLLKDLNNNFDEASFYTTYLNPDIATCIDIQLNRLP